MIIIDINRPPIDYIDAILWVCDEFRFDDPEKDFFVEYLYANDDAELHLLTILNEVLQ